MEKINTVVDGRLMSVPVLTASHLAAMSKIRSGMCPGCAPDILQDLVLAGLVEDMSNGN
ncbi:hypothetical protein [Brevibacillus nitrificans]|uniref:hypothetical protein n=1 Tax=Brevibacillus nitrificans TaxID=651560 RepID=UPI002860C1C8|nr:hypothetical protein [Brevibacillus nitrificans]MDR7318937.1 hypothetical protein [Brevibacillus nitrificans]